mgnify:CR=1 FL=1
MAFAAELLNTIESELIGGVNFTKFYTRTNTNLEVGNKVYIVNGNYDSYNIIQTNPYNEFASGYTVLKVSENSIVLNIPFVNNKPYFQDDFDNYIKLYYIDNQEDFDYIDGIASYNNPLFNTTESRKFEFNNIAYFDSVFNGLTTSGFHKIIGTGWVNIDNLFISGSVPSLTNSNGILYVADGSFTFSYTLSGTGYSTYFEENKYYTYSSPTWNRFYDTDIAFISNKVFREGEFIQGSFEGGIFGDNKIQGKWDKNASWLNGVMLNTIIDNGNVIDSTGSRTTKIARIKGNTIETTTEFTNNQGFGYSFIYDSILINGNIRNGNLFNIQVGTSSTFSVLDDYYNGTQSNFISKINGGRYFNSFINNTNINNASIFGGVVVNSLFKNAEASNIESIRSVYIDSDNNLKYSIKPKNIKISSTLLQDKPQSLNIGLYLAKTYKFIITEEEYKRIKIGKEFYINNIITSQNNTELVNYFENRALKIGNFVSGEYLIEVAPRTPFENRYLPIIGTATSDRIFNNDDDFSVDVSFKTLALSGTTSLTAQQIFNFLDNTVGLNVTPLEVINSNLVQNSFENSVMGSASTFNTHWVSDFDLILATYSVNVTSSVGTLSSSYSYHSYDMDFIGSSAPYTLRVRLNANNNWNDNKIQLNDIVYLNNVVQYQFSPTGAYDPQYIYDLTGKYQVINANYATKEFELQDYNQSVLSNVNIAPNVATASPTYSFRLFTSMGVLGTTHNKNTSLYKFRIEDSFIQSGLIGNPNLINTTINNESLDSRDYLNFKNLNKLKVLQLFEGNNKITGTNSVFSQFVPNTLHKASYHQLFSWTDKSLFEGIVYEGFVIQDSMFTNFTSTVFSGTFRFVRGQNLLLNNATFVDSTEYPFQVIPPDKVLAPNKFLYSNNQLPSGWFGGDFYNSIFENSLWWNGNFYSGELYSSSFVNGTVYGGVFGRDGRPAEFWGGEWRNGKFVFGKFGVDTNTPINAPILGYVLTNGINSVWKNGTFENGVISSYNLGTLNTFTTWENGIFNNGQIKGLNTRWLNGIFNNGKFESVYGTGQGNTASWYSWENGTFNGGVFGTGKLNPNQNSKWYNGKMNGGIFQGRVWNNGVFLSGKFFGSGLFSLANPVTDAVKFRNHFVEDLNYISTVPIISNPDFTSTSDWQLNNASIFSGFLNFSGLTAVGEVATQSVLFPSNQDYFFTVSISQSNVISSNNNRILVELVNTSTNNVLSFALPIAVTISNFTFSTGNNDYDVLRLRRNNTNPLAALTDVLIDYIYVSQSSTNFYGLWRDGIMVDNIRKSNIQSLIESENIDNANLVSQTKKLVKDTRAEMLNTVWLSGTISHNDGIIDNSQFLTGYFDGGTFRRGAFNPRVYRSQAATQSFEFTTNTLWNNGVFRSGAFYISEWKNGEFGKNSTLDEFPTMVGGLFKKGIWWFGNALNIIFENGTWKNGNWYGSNFNLAGSGSVVGADYEFTDEDFKYYLSVNAGRLFTDPYFGGGNVHIWNKFRLNGGNKVYDSINQNTLVPLSGTIGTYQIGLATNLWTGFATTNLFADVALNVTQTRRIFTKVGNGVFKSGIWEAGVWNNGYRYDDVLIMDDVSNFFQIGKNKYRVVLSTTNPILNVSAGDLVSIGNIVGIDVNNDRQLLNNVVRVVETTNSTITFDIAVNFNPRVIKKDSDFHKMYVSKNIWDNGVLFSGYVRSGVWNNGYVKGGKFITTFSASQWKDGTFDGGWFISRTQSDVNGNVYNSGLVQHMVFHLNDLVNNPTPTTGRYNSHMDLVYASYSRSTIFSDLQSGGVYNYNQGGQITEDVLSSTSFIKRYRTNVIEPLSLGTKFKQFDMVFGNNFLNEDEYLKWLYTVGNIANSVSYTGLTFTPFFGGALQQVLSTDNISRAFPPLNNEVPQNRYIKFDIQVEDIQNTPGLILPGITGTDFSKLGNGYWSDYFYNPIMNFTTLSVVPFFGGQSIPEYFNTNFNNKIFLVVKDLSQTVLDNIYAYETDAIPFYDLYSFNNAYSAAQVDNLVIPNIGFAPIIDYNNEDFNFVDSVKIGLDAQAVQTIVNTNNNIIANTANGNLFVQ